MGSDAQGRGFFTRKIFDDNSFWGDVGYTSDGGLFKGNFLGEGVIFHWRNVPGECPILSVVGVRIPIQDYKTKYSGCDWAAAVKTHTQSF